MIGAKRVRAPDGTEWRVGRRWLPDKPTLWRREGDAEGGDWLSSAELDGADDVFVVVIAVVAVIATIVFLTTVVFPIIVLAFEVMVVLVLLVGGIAGRLVLRKPWTIRARAEHGRELTWRAQGWRRSGRVRDDVAAALALGQTDIRPTEALEAA